MRLGFTGTQRGMTAKQKKAFTNLILQKSPAEFHHGDCIGADEIAHIIFRESCNGKIILHPPSKQGKRAFCEADVSLTPLPYLDRNKEIVINSDELIAAPGEFEEQLRSGTWSTVRFARKQGHPIHIILPDGTVQFEPDPMF